MIHALLTLVVVTAPTPTDDPQAILQEKTAEVKALMGKPADEARRVALHGLVADLVDYQELARSSLRKHWDARSEPERAEFTLLLQQLIEKSYLDQVAQQPDFDVAWEGSKRMKDGARAKVSTLARAGKTAIEIEYRMVRRDTGWVVADIAVDGVSMVRNYRGSFGKIIQADGWTALLEKMRAKLAE